MTVVVDASVALKWVLDEPGSDDAMALRQEDLAAPAFFLVECANALWTWVARGNIDAEDALTRFSELSEAPVALSPPEADIHAALRLATELKHPVYDCMYLACALRLNAQVVTDDRRFMAAVARRPDLKDRVRKLGD